MTPSPQRRAFSLIEMLMTISIGSTIMLTAVALLHKSLQLQIHSQDRVELSLGLDRFIEVFRRDVHAAARAENNSDSSLTFNLENGDRIAYSVQDHRLLREYESESGRQVEQVRLAENEHANYRLESEAQIAVLEIHKVPEPNATGLTRQIAVSLRTWSPPQPTAEVTELEETP